MTRTELKKIGVLGKVVDGIYTNAEGAALLGFSERQLIRLKKHSRRREKQGSRIRTEVVNPCTH